MYNTPSDGKRTAHIVVGTGIMALFGINTVTGAWNLWEARNDQNVVVDVTRVYQSDKDPAGWHAAFVTP